MELTGKQKSFLRSLGQTLKPTIMIGKMGVTDNTLLSIRNGFNTKELLKIKVQDGCAETEEEVSEKVTEGTGATAVQIVGHTILLFKRDHKNPKIELP